MLNSYFETIKDTLNLNADAFALLYLACGVLFILGLKGLSHPRSARRGNALAMMAMGLAIVTTLLHPSVTDYTWILAGLVAGAVVGIPIALKIKMTSMPQLVAILNSFGGLAAALIGIGMHFALAGETAGDRTEIFMGAWIGLITFSGSIIAFSKLSGYMKSAAITFPMQHMFNLLVGFAMIATGVLYIQHGDVYMLYAFAAIAFTLGVLIIIPIGGADMPVVVSLLNSYSGWAAVATGFTLENTLLIMTGSIVGSSGAILTYVMCKAMNRSFFNVLLGGFGADDDAGAAMTATGGTVKQASADDAAFMMENANGVVIVPGYGMAVAQAQHALREVMDILEEKNIKARFAIHPVAGRMPGHMNVLLAEADVPYENVAEMDNINADFATTDVVLVVGANDVVNPDAKNVKSSPLYGMPILDAYKAKTVYVVKRSMNAGYAGVDNALFTMDNTSMIFGDAKEVAERLAAALKMS
ncbi:MAG: NAD(P)(+) transhydrogenase (Re/Si-specific) subunit beta [Alphaproteobacteria bacterium]|nr:NAD(P)(+) transhydrogenase (Re/Si-specific) subunit beta [Alphaproteobacteria bacterium]